MEQLSKGMQQVVDDIRSRDSGAHAPSMKHSFTEGQPIMTMGTELDLLSKQYQLAQAVALKDIIPMDGPQFISATDLETNSLNLTVI